MNESLSAQFLDTELDRLETLLDDPIFEGAALSLDEIQGFLCAAFAGPSPAKEDVWLIDVLGAEAVLETPVGQETSHLLRRFANALKEDLNQGRLPTLILYPADEEDNDFSSWAHAYLSALDASETDWFDFLADLKNDEDCEEIHRLDEMLFPLMVLSGEAETAAREHGEEWPEGEELAEFLAECQEALAESVVDVYEFWAKIRKLA